MPTLDEIVRNMAASNSAINEVISGCIPFTPYVSSYHDTDCCCCCSGDPQPSNIIEGICKDVTEEEE